MSMGRKDELVRGVDMIGTPLSTFSNIAALAIASVPYRTCGAESGWVPTAPSPMIFVSKIETQRRQKEDQQARILPAPKLKNTEVKVAEPTTDVKAKRAADDKTIFVMADELGNSAPQQKLFYPNYPKAFYVDYNMARSQEFDVMASLGGIVKAQKNPVIAMGGISLKLGDSTTRRLTPKSVSLPTSTSAVR